MLGIDKRQLFLKALNATGGLRLLENINSWHGLLILNYHRIGCSEGSPFDHNLWSATESDFECQVKYLKAHFDIVSLSDLDVVAKNLQSRGQQKSRFAMITFDDGYLDNFELAYPILRTHGVPGVFFICTGFIDQRELSWWDEISWMVRTTAVKTLPANRFLPTAVDIADPDKAIPTILRRFYTLPGHQTDCFINLMADALQTGRAPSELARSMWMNWEQVREMRARGMSIGAHTVNHPILSQLTLEDQLFEVTESRLRLEHELGESVNAFSYPVGRRDSFNKDTRRALTQAGFDWAFSYYGGFVKNNVDRLDIPRIAIESDITLTDFRSYAALPQVFARH